MKFKLGTLFITGFIASVGIAGSNPVCTAYPGSYICEEGQVDHISGFYGSVVLEKVAVSGTVKGSFGALSIEDSKLNQMNANIGSVVATHTAFSGMIEGNIAVLLLQSSILNEINACVASVHLNQSTSGKMTLSCTDKMKVVLKNKSSVSGDIHFTKRAGIVCVDESSELKGHVINGALVQGSCKRYEG